MAFLLSINAKSPTLLCRLAKWLTLAKGPLGCTPSFSTTEPVLYFGLILAVTLFYLGEGRMR
jgi:hypothetical protein